MCNVGQRWVTSLIVAGLLLSSSGVWAQAPDTSTSFVDEHTIDQMAEAYVAIGEIHARAKAELAQADDQAEARQVMEDAEGAIIRAVEQTGLELREFNRLSELASLDPALNARILERVKEREPI